MCGGSDNKQQAQPAPAPALPADIQSVLNTLYMDPSKAVNPSDPKGSMPQVATDMHNAQVSGPSGYSADIKKNLGMTGSPLMGYGDVAPQPSGMVNSLDKKTENPDFVKLFSR